LLISSSHAGQIYTTEPSPPDASAGSSPIILSDASTTTTADAPLAPAALLHDSTVTAAATLTLNPEVERRNPVLAQQCKTAFARLADAAIYADSPLMAHVAHAQSPVAKHDSRVERLATFSLSDWTPGALAAISISVREQFARIMSGLEFLNL
jgi:hypothetical protein